jgi:TetR/AcrR family transcriptional regulator, transcriptional repressor for nem operon
MHTKAHTTRQLIIEEAAALFNTKGYAGTSLSSIMEATGLAKGALYGHFDSKEQIAQHSFSYAYSKLRNALVQIIKAHSTATDKLLAVFNFYTNYTLHPILPGGCPLLNTAIEADDNFPALKKLAADALTEMLSSLTAIIKKGIITKEFSAAIDPKKEANYIFASIEGAIMISQLTHSPKILNEVLAHLKIQVQTRYQR